jgi:hypothetical protein
VREDEVINLSVRIGSTYPTLLALLEADAPPEAAACGSPSNSASTPRFRLGQCRGVLDAGEEQRRPMGAGRSYNRGQGSWT